MTPFGHHELEYLVGLAPLVFGMVAMLVCMLCVLLRDHAWYFLSVNVELGAPENSISGSVFSLWTNG